MRTTIACLCFALLLRGLFDASVKAAPEPGDLEDAMENLYQSTDDVGIARVDLRYVTNPDLPPDAVEVNPDDVVPEGALWQQPPLTRPAGVPEDRVPTRLFQLRREGEGWTYRFLGWLYLKPSDVADLHGRLISL